MALIPALNVEDLAADHTWTEVTRVSTACIMGDDGRSLHYPDGELFTEGRSRGWPGDAGRDAYAFNPEAASPRSRWPYGCWFYLVRGTGIAVNVGRSLRAFTRRDVHARLGISCADGSYCTAPPGDKLYCHLAVKAGFQSIQIARAHFNGRPELIMCAGRCLTAAVGDVCPPLPLHALRSSGRAADRSGTGPENDRRCRCNHESALLSCDRHSKVNCSQARPARADMWHHACRSGLYPHCVSGNALANFSATI